MRRRPLAAVVGSGLAGATFARVLSLAGSWDVVVLEKGRNLFDGLGGPAEGVSSVLANDELACVARTPPFGQDPLLEPRTFRSEPSEGERSFVGEVQFLPTTVGGGSIHFDGKYRRFREVDFIANSLLGGGPGHPAIEGTTYADWPLSYAQLEPFYAVAEELAATQGPARLRGGRVDNPNPYESWRSTPFPMPPGVPMLSSLLVAEAARRLGYVPAEVPTAAASRPYRGRRPCNDCGHCLRYGCPVGAKASGVWPLNEALHSGRARLLPEANVIRLEHEKGRAGSFRATGVAYLDSGGQEHFLDADLVILANTPIEAVRLSILSGIAEVGLEPRPSSTEPSGLLGHNLTFHRQTVAVALLDTEIHPWRGRTSSHTLDAFAGSGPDPANFDPEVPRGGVLEIGGSYGPIAEADAVPGLFGEGHRALMRFGPFSKRIVALTLQGEDMPQLANHVDLDPEIVDAWGQPVPRITYKPHPYELSAAAYYGPRMLEILDAIGGPGSPHPVKPLISLLLDEEMLAAGRGGSRVPATAHVMGTHRMALSPEEGPCDPFGRYWAFENLYHVGGGLFPTAPGFNVSLTIQALAYRCAASVVAGVGGLRTFDHQHLQDAQPALESVLKKLDPGTMIASALSS